MVQYTVPHEYSVIADCLFENNVVFNNYCLSVLFYFSAYANCCSNTIKCSEKFSLQSPPIIYSRREKSRYLETNTVLFVVTPHK